MAAFQEWYNKRSPYIHNPPDEEGNDNFQPFFIKRIDESKIDLEYQDIIWQLKAASQKAEQVERDFFLSHNWGASDVEDFNARFLAMPKFQKQLKSKSLPAAPRITDSSLFQQVRWILNSPILHNIINSRDRAFFQGLEGLNGDDTKMRDKFFTKRGIAVLEQKYHESIQDYISNTSDLVISRLAVELFDNPSKKKSNVFKVNRSQQIRDANKNIKQILTQYSKSDSKERGRALIEIEKIVRANLPTLIQPITDDVMQKAMSFIRTGLQQIPIDFFDELDSTERTEYVDQRRVEVINFILAESEAFLTKLLYVKGGVQKQSGSLPEANVTGDIQEFAFIISSKVADALQTKGALSKEILNNKLIRELGGEYSQNKDYWANKVKIPVDAQIGKFLFQLKGHREAILGLETQFNPVEIHSGTRPLGKLLEMIGETGAMSKEETDQFLYTYANYAARGDSGQITGAATLLINWAVEFFIRSDTARSLLEAVDGLPARSGGKLALNHFWIIGNKLIGVSSVIKAAALALSKYTTVDSWYQGSASLTYPAFDMGAFVADKLKKRELNRDWVPGSRYSQEVLDYGKEKGKELVDASRLTSLSINISTLRHIQEAVKV